jgi:hypothetical protein
MPYSERGSVPQQDQTIGREGARGDQPVSYDGCRADLPKGGIVDAAKMLEQKTLVTDTGAFAKFLEKYEEEGYLDEATVDGIYRESIGQGVIDHHSIDQFLASRGVKSEKCATQMVVDYEDAVSDAVKKNSIDKVSTHVDSDMDAICSSYLVKSIIDRGRLPDIAGELAEVANRVDYGRFDISDPRVFAESLPGTIDAIKGILKERGGAELGAEVFSRAELKAPNGRLNAEGVKRLEEISAKYEDLRNGSVFELLNALDQAKKEDPTLKLDGNIDGVIGRLPATVQELITEGRKKVIESHEKFLAEFEKAEKFKVTVKDKRGRDMEANVIIGQSPEPLTFTNLAYLRTSPDTIVAVYAGKDRKAGDNYDIGITPDMANAIDLRRLCLELNKAEKAKRDAILAKPAEQRTPDEQEKAVAWEKQKTAGQTRKMFGGIDEMVSAGEVAAEDVVDVDPTVLVAGDSLIAASRTSLLTGPEFSGVIRKFSR